MLLSDDQRKVLQEIAFQHHPYEACGFVMNDGLILEIDNICPEPKRGFNMCPIDATNKLGAEGYSDIVGVWHTHPGGNVHPSKTDQDAMWNGSVQRHWTYIIVTKDEVAEYDSQLMVPPVGNHYWTRFLNE